MLDNLFDAVFFLLISVAYAGVHKLYGWRGTAAVFAPIALMFGLVAADSLGWLTLYDINEMLKAACWWLALGAIGTAYAVVVMKQERRP